MHRIKCILSTISAAILISSTTNGQSEIGDTIRDIDGNIYQTVKIGNQTWMAENLKTTKFNDGTPINNINNGQDWNIEVEDRETYCWLNFDNGKKDLGAYYNLNTVLNDKLCPSGWHVPSKEEWNALIEVLGGKEASVAKLMTAEGSRWDLNKIQPTNESGFSAFPTGFIGCSGLSVADGPSSFYNTDYEATYWSSSFDDFLFWSNRIFEVTEHSVFENWIKGTKLIYGGYSVRCIKDQ